MTYDIVIIGAGISGATLAERISSRTGKKILVVEKRNHIAGNCYDYIDKAGVLVPKYGPHFFHTNDESVWTYVSKFTEWHQYEHRVLSSVHGLQVPVPVNINTINILTGSNIKTENEAKKWLKENTYNIKTPKNSEEASLTRVGKFLYEKMFKNYTYKQWDLWPKQLDASVMNRIPVRSNFDDRYFTDTHQAMPKYGYTKIFKKMLDHKNIHLMLNTDYDDIKDRLKGDFMLFYTGPIDQFFSYKLNKKLQYRSLRFEYQTLKMKYFQTRAQINYPNDNDFTRITEPKHATGQQIDVTTIIKEYSTWEGEPYYPVPNEKNQALYEQYRKEAQLLESRGTYFVGRLANYKYFNMDQAFKNSLNLFEAISSKI
jgi:UDP-galactopyranose mutase